MESSGARQRNTIKFFSNEEYDFTGNTLILPAVSVGNIGQLAVDLHLENLHPRPLRIGQIFHAALEPVIGNGENGNLLVACELFRHAEKKLTILQFHSPVTRRSHIEFVTFLVEWIRSSNFQEVLCLGSSMASLRNDVQLNVSVLRYLAGNFLNTIKIDQMKRLGWRELESAATGGLNGTTPSIQDGGLRIPGGGIARDLFLACNSAQIPILTLICFASDGNNTTESTSLVRSAALLYQFFPPDSKTGEVKLRFPQSWAYLNDGSEPASIF